MSSTSAFAGQLAGRVALVTGAATGIGRATAKALAQAGAAVAVNHLRQPDAAAQLLHEIEALGARAAAFDADVTRAAEVAQLVQVVEDRFGPIDVLVNNAGIILEKPLAETGEDEWDHLLAADLKSVFLVTRAVLPGMQARQRGAFVNIASDLGILGRTHFTAYCAAKAGVIGLTRALAREVAPHIRVNAVAPGAVNTAMVSPELMSAESLAQELGVPQGRIAEPAEIAASVVFLASDLARFYCGQVLGPNGGSVMP
ncbi:MAG: SDR family NAD(P)-dependent oxidoreductase [Curvibacter sp.]|jgi:3-oxoacyl-[acyl-carrier protein] reductase|nr:3-oxoacyl-ACP reductase FabG [Curvibacter sp.]